MQPRNACNGETRAVNQPVKMGAVSPEDDPSTLQQTLVDDLEALAVF